MTSLARLHCSKTTLGAAVEAFLADRDLAPSTRRAYRATYGSLLQAFGARCRSRPSRPSSSDAGSPSLVRGQAAPGDLERKTHRVPGSYRLLPAPGLARSATPATCLERRRTLRDETRAVPLRGARCAVVARRYRAARESPVAHALRHGRAGQRDPRPRRRGSRFRPVNVRRSAARAAHREIIVWAAATARLLPPLPGRSPPRSDLCDRASAQRRSGRAGSKPRRPGVGSPTSGRGLCSVKHREGQWTLHQLRHSAR